MKTIQINGNEVVVGAETLRRIEKIAEEKNVPVDEAIAFCLQRVVRP